MFEIECEVGQDLVSSAYRHVHHAALLRFLETARSRFHEEIGFPNEAFLAKQLFVVISGLKVAYKREVTAGKIRVTCEAPRIEGRLVIVDQRILNARGKVAVEAVVELQFLSGATRRAVPPPEDFARAFAVNDGMLNSLPAADRACAGG